MNLYRIQTEERQTFWVIAPDPTAAQVKLRQLFVDNKYNYRPLALEIALIAGAGICGKPQVLIT